MMVGVAAAIVTLCVFDPAVKFVVAAVLAFTTQVPAPVELKLLPLTNAHGPLMTL